MQEQYKHLQISHIEMIKKDLWLTDYHNIQTQIDFIQELKYVHYVELYDDENKLYTSGYKQPALSKVLEENLYYSYKKEKVLIGRIALFFDYDDIDKKVRTEFIRLFSIIIFLSFVLSITGTLIFKLLIGRHISSLSNYLMQDHDSVLNNHYVMKRKNKKNDELSILENSINSMTEKIRSYIEHEKNFTKQLQEESDFKNKVLSIISHDLRGPLGSFSGLTQDLIENKENIPDKDKWLIIKEIHKSSKSLHLLTENLLSWSKKDSIISSYKPILIPVSENLSEIESIFSIMLSDKNINFIMNVNSYLTVYSDEHMFGIIMRNLISNSIKFTSKGGEIIITALTDNDYCSITVKDTGNGMTAEQIQQFYKDKSIPTSTGTEQEKGTGLGLALCHQYVNINHGKIIIDSGKQGTSITVLLPKDEASLLRIMKAK